MAFDARDPTGLNWGSTAAGRPCSNGDARPQHPATCPHLQPCRPALASITAMNWAWAIWPGLRDRDPATRTPDGWKRGAPTGFLRALQTPFAGAAGPPIPSPV